MFYFLGRLAGETNSLNQTDLGGDTNRQACDARRRVISGRTPNFKNINLTSESINIDTIFHFELPMSNDKTINQIQPQRVAFARGTYTVCPNVMNRLLHAPRGGTLLNTAVSDTLISCFELNLPYRY